MEKTEPAVAQDTTETTPVTEEAKGESPTARPEEKKIQWPTKEELPDNCVVFGKLPLQTTESTLKTGISLIAEGVEVESIEIYNDKRSVIQEKIANVYMKNIKRDEFLEKVKGKYMKIVNKDYDYNQPFHIKIVV